MAPSGEIDKPGKIYLGNLAIETDESSIETIFKKYGKIREVQIIKHRETGVSKGFGFVTYENPDDADDAVKGMDGKEVDSNIVKVDHALKSAGRGGDRGGRGRGRGSDRGRGHGGRGEGSFEPRGGRELGMFQHGGGRGRATPLMRGRGGLSGRGAPIRGRAEPLLSTPDDPYGRPDREEMYERAPRRYKDELDLPPTRSLRPTQAYRGADYAEATPLMDRDELPLSFERSSYRSDSLLPSREGRLPVREGRLPAREGRLSLSYAQESAGYDSLLASRNPRAATSAYGREEAYEVPERPSRASAAAAYGRDSGTAFGRDVGSAYGRDAGAAYGRDAGSAYGRDAGSAYRSEPDPYAKVSAYDRLEASLGSRKLPPAASATEDLYGREAAGGYGASRVPREYGAERVARTELVRDPYSRDPYGAREAPVVREYQAERARNVSAVSRDLYPARPEYAAAAREPSARSAYPREYEKQAPRDFATERNGAYAREKEVYGKLEAKTYADSYGRASERQVGGGAASSRFDAYSSRDPYAMTARADKVSYSPRESYGSPSLGARGARSEGGAAGGSRGYARR